MKRTLRTIRTIALAAAVLLFWCHTLDGVMATGAQGRIAAIMADVAVPASPGAGDMQVRCCPGNASGGALSATLTRSPQGTAPLLAGLLWTPLLLVALRSVRAAPLRLAAHRASLVAQSVLIRV